MSVRRKVAIGFVLVLGAAPCGVIAAREIHQGVVGRREVQALLATFDVGTLRRDLQDRLTSGQYQRLRWSESTNRIYVETPYTFGAENWVVYITLDSNDRVCAIRIRTADSVNAIPSGATPDRVAAGCPPMFPR